MSSYLCISTAARCFSGSAATARRTSSSLTSYTSLCSTEGRRSETWRRDRKSTRLNSSHLVISYAVFCLKKKHNPPDLECEKEATLQRARVAIIQAGLGESVFFFFFNGTATTEIYPLPLPDALPI